MWDIHKSISGWGRLALQLGAAAAAVVVAVVEAAAVAVVHHPGSKCSGDLNCDTRMYDLCILNYHGMAGNWKTLYYFIHQITITEPHIITSQAWSQSYQRNFNLTPTLTPNTPPTPTPTLQPLTPTSTGDKRTSQAQSSRGCRATAIAYT
jgi:hypothetical protein